MDGNGVVVGIIADTGSGVTEMLQNRAASVIRPGQPFDPTSEKSVAIDYALDVQDWATRELSEMKVERLRRGGTQVFIASHDRDLLRRVSDEIWWFDGG